MNKSDKELINLIEEIDHQAKEEGLSNEVIANSFYVLSRYVKNIISSRHFSESSLKMIFEEIILKDTEEQDLIERISINPDKDNMNYQIAEYIEYILTKFIRTAIKAKKISADDLNYLIRETRGENIS